AGPIVDVLAGLNDELNQSMGRVEKWNLKNGAGLVCSQSAVKQRLESQQRADIPLVGELVDAQDLGLVEQHLMRLVVGAEAAEARAGCGAFNRVGLWNLIDIAIGINVGGILSQILGARRI